MIEENKFLNPKCKYEIIAKENGYLNIESAAAIGNFGVEIGAGRKFKGEEIDFNAGINFNFDQGDAVKKGDVLATVFADKVISEASLATANKIIRVTSLAPEHKNIIIDTI